MCLVNVHTEYYKRKFKKSNFDNEVGPGSISTSNLAFNRILQCSCTFKYTPRLRFLVSYNLLGSENQTF